MDLMNYYKINFAMKQHHHWSLFEMESMLPWEREIYTNMLMQHLKEEKEKLKQMQNNNGKNS